MELANCCGNRQLQWTQSRVGERWSDIYVCASCQHIHAMESWLAPIEWPGAERCVNCAGTYAQTARSKEPPKCERCGLPPAKDKATHDQLVSAHPEKSFVKGADVARALGRHILALKLATAATRWGPVEDAAHARRLRIESLVSIGKIDSALDEVYDWAHNGGGPPLVWSLIAGIEAESGNIEGAMLALKYGVQVDPRNADMWADYAELLLLTGDGSRALDAARHVMEWPEMAERGIAVIAEVAEGMYREGHPHDAKIAANVAGAKIDETLALTWLLARVAAKENDEEQSVAWLQKTLKLDPEHAEAKAAYESLRPVSPGKKTGWLW